MTRTLTSTTTTVVPRKLSSQEKSPTIPNNNKKELYLLTDDGFLRRLLTQLVGSTSLVMLVLSVSWLREAAIEVYYKINDWMLATAHRYAWWSLLGLLSSSCCALQLLLNALSMGCAGFNSILGPWRPTLLAWTCLVQVGSWVVAWDRPYQWAPTATASVVVLSLALLPEVLHSRFIYGGNTSKKKYMSTTVKKNNKHVATKGTAASSAVDEIEKPTTPAATIDFRFQMTSVGCAACLVTIHHALKNLPEVVDIQACMETNVLRVDCHPTTKQDTILDCLQEAGFPMEPMD